MNTLRFAAVAALALSLSMPAQATDYGGKVWEYALRAKAPKRINHTCMSACTLYLANPGTCAGPNARFVFHAVTGAGKHNRRLTQWLMNQYPAAIRSWIRANGGLTSRPITLQGAALRARVRSCA